MSNQKSENPEREQRILNAASELIVHYGFDKTTVSDIAREAGVSKGAIYLHFASKDELFEALLIQEMQAYTERWLNLLQADPDGGTIGSMYKNTLYAMNASPFMSAVFKQDTRVLGSYIRKPDNIFRQQQAQNPRLAFVQMMQGVGAIRMDMKPEVIAHIMDMLAYGLVSMNDVKDEAHIPPTDDLIEGIAELMNTALTPPNVDKAAGKQILQKIVDASRQRFDEEKSNITEGDDA